MSKKGDNFLESVEVNINPWFSDAQRSPRSAREQLDGANTNVSIPPREKNRIFFSSHVASVSYNVKNCRFFLQIMLI